MKNAITFLLVILFFNVSAQVNLKTFGDSNTEFWIDLPKEKKWAFLASTEMGVTLENYAHAGATIYGNNGLEGERAKAAGGAKDYVTFMFGTNDAANQPQTVTDTWKQDYKRFIKESFIDAGYDKNKLILISPNYNPESGQASHYLPTLKKVKEYCREIAQELGIQYIDFYAALKYGMEEAPVNSVYKNTPSHWLDGLHLNYRGHRFLADLVIEKIKPVAAGGTQYIKLFGAGSAMAGASAYTHNFAHLLGRLLGKSYHNYAIAGTGVTANFAGDTAQLDVQKKHAGDGDKGIALFLYGNNDGNGSDAWKNAYKGGIQHFIDAGYGRQNLVIITQALNPSLANSDAANYNRLKEANTAIRKVAAELNIRLLDLETLSLEALGFADDYHLGDKGNETVAQKLKELFSTSLPNNGGTCSILNGSLFKAGDMVKVGYHFLQGPLAAGNTFTVQLSDANGHFTQPMVLKTVAGTASNDHIEVVLPSSLSCGNGFRIRVLSSSPNDVVTPSSPFTIGTLPAAVILNMAAENTICDGDSLKLMAQTTNGAQYQWYRNDAVIQNASSSFYYATQPGSYKVKTILAPCGEQTSAGYTVAEKIRPVSKITNLSGEAFFCTGGSIKLIAQAGTDYSFEWYKNDQLVATTTGNEYIVHTAGKWKVLAKAPNSCTGSTSAAVVIKESTSPALPVVSANGSPAFCEGGSVVLTSSFATGNQWYRNNTLIEGATQQTYTATVGGGYTVAVTQPGCGTATSAETRVTITPLPLPATITAQGSTNLCENANVLLSSSSETGNQWYRDGNSITGATGQTYSANAPGVYTTRIYANGCITSASNAIAIDGLSAQMVPSISASGPTTFCTGGGVTLTSSSASSNQWLKNGEVIPGAVQATYSVTEPGNYAVKVTAGSCSAVSPSLTIIITPVPAAPLITPSGSTTLCEGNNVVLSAPSNASLQWYKDGVAIAGANQAHYTATSSGQYTIRAGSGTCAVTSAPIQVNVKSLPAPPVINPLAPINFCQGGTSLLASSVPSGNQWYKDGIAITGATDQTYKAVQDGSYTVRVEQNGCTSPASNSIAIVVNPIPAVPTVSAAGPTTFCEGGSVVLSSSAGTGNQWYKDGAAINEATNAQFIARESGIYTVKNTQNNCLSSVSTGVKVVVNSMPQVPIITVNSNTLSSSAPAGNQWHLNGNAISGATGSKYTATESGHYTVTVTHNGCEVTSAITKLEVINPGTFQLSHSVNHYPNPFTDRVMITNQKSKTLYVKMLDILGRVVYQAQVSARSHQIETGRMMKGTYVLQVTDMENKETINKMMIKQ